MSVIDDVRLSAYNQDKEPNESWKPPELVMWYSFRELYNNYRSGKLTKQDAEQVKAEILKRYSVQKTEYDVMKSIVHRQAEMWQKIELAGNKYGIERTLENADAFMKAVYDVNMKAERGNDNG